MGRISLCILEAFSIYRLSVGRISLCMLKPIPTTNTAGCGIGCRLGCPRLWTPLRTWCNIWTKTAFVCRLCAMSCMYVCVVHVHAIKYANRAPALIVAPRKISRFFPDGRILPFLGLLQASRFFKRNSVVNYFPSGPPGRHLKLRGVTANQIICFFLKQLHAFCAGAGDMDAGDVCG